jgi:hypothetical protein
VIPEIARFREEGLVTPRRIRRRKRKDERLLLQGGIESGSPA